jgi:hypothetical protein
MPKFLDIKKIFEKKSSKNVSHRREEREKN